MGPKQGGKCSGDWRLYLAFATLAVLAGPVAGYSGDAMLGAAQFQVFAGLALAELVAGGMLMGCSVAMRERLPGARRWGAAQWGVLLLLLVPQWCAVPFSSGAGPIPWMHGLGSGTALLLSLAAPLWLGLVAASDVLQVEVPRTVVAAAIVGMGAVCLVIPATSYAVAWNQIPALLLHLLLGIAMVVSWVIARPRLEGCSAEWSAGGYLLLSGVGDLFFAWMYERSSWQPLDGHALAVPLLRDAATFAAMWWLWFWLLQRMTLAAFSMRALAAWTASVALGVFFIGFREWRLDAALAIAGGALVIALRAQLAEEQPLALGLGKLTLGRKA